MCILGIDIAKAKFDVALLKDGKTTDASFKNTPAGFEKFGKWLAKMGVQTAHACMEATGNYGEQLASWLHDQGLDVSVVNPLVLHAYARSQMVRNKTDKTDAGLIARFCEKEQPGLWHPKPPEVRDLQALLRHLDALKEDRVRWVNRLSAEPASAFVKDSIRQQIGVLEQAIKQVEQHIADHIDQHPGLKQDAELLRSIPGIGPNTAAALLSIHLGAFSDARAAVAFAGLSPKTHRSGSSVHRQDSLSKLGDGRLRKSLYMPALAALRANPTIKALAERLTARHKHAMVIVAAAMRKLLVLAYGVLKSRQPFSEKFGLPQVQSA